ncbi:MAG: cation transporter [Bacteroidales bacterium]|nr:cation transporter [Bacteroidales bacterium]
MKTGNKIIDLIRGRFPIGNICLWLMIFILSSTDLIIAQKSSEKIKTESIKVWGNCESCKQRIEKAAKIEGVSKASWDTKTKTLVISYDPSKTTIDKVQKQIASVGHDTEKYRADDKAYKGLPGCCKYDRRK